MWKGQWPMFVPHCTSQTQAAQVTAHRGESLLPVVLGLYVCAPHLNNTGLNSEALPLA